MKSCDSAADRSKTWPCFCKQRNADIPPQKLSEKEQLPCLLQCIPAPVLSCLREMHFTHTRARARTHTHTHTRARTHTTFSAQLHPLMADMHCTVSTANSTAGLNTSCTMSTDVKISRCRPINIFKLQNERSRLSSHSPSKNKFWYRLTITNPESLGPVWVPD